MTDLKHLWEDSVEEMELSHAHFSTWFRDTRLVQIENGTASIEVPNSFTQEWLQKKFHPDIFSSLKRRISGLTNVHYVISRKTDVGSRSTLIDEIRKIVSEEIRSSTEEILAAVRAK
jgi:chromosomal replication initiation ATPase DnaA